MNKSVSVIVCTIDKDPLTVKSIPDYAEILIADWKSNRKDIWAKSIARNMGAAKAKGEILVFMDGDISFSKEFFEKLVSIVDEETIAGLKCKWHNYLISRAIAIRKDTFITVGGFCPIILAMEDIDFSYRLEKLGYNIKYFPVDSVYHKPHKGTDTRTIPQHIRTELCFAFKYPKYFKKLPRKFVEFFYHRIAKPRG